MYVYIRENDLMKINNEKGPTHFIFMKFPYTAAVLPRTNILANVLFIV